MSARDVSLADAMAFEEFTEEQQRIAFAGVALRNLVHDTRSLARQEGFDAGLAAAGALNRGDVHDIYERLMTFRQVFTPADSRYIMLGEILGDLGKLLDAARA